jgi:hypothetical protein
VPKIVTSRLATFDANLLTLPLTSSRDARYHLSSNGQNLSPCNLTTSASKISSLFPRGPNTQYHDQSNESDQLGSTVLPLLRFSHNFNNLLGKRDLCACTGNSGLKPFTAQTPSSLLQQYHEGSIPPELSHSDSSKGTLRTLLALNIQQLSPSVESFRLCALPATAVLISFSQNSNSETSSSLHMTCMALVPNLHFWELRTKVISI